MSAPPGAELPTGAELQAGAELPPTRSPVNRAWLAGHRAAELGVLVVVLAWAANFIVVKGANREIPPIAFAWLRFSLSALLLLGLLRWREGSVAMTRAQVLPIMGLGAIGFGIYQMLWGTALQSIPAGDSAFLIAATPVFTALFASIAGSDVLTRRKLAGALVSFAGVGIVIAAGPGLGLGASLLGDGLTLLAAACWAIYSSWGAPVLIRHSPLRTTAWAMVGGSVALLPIGLFQASGTDWGSVSPGAWAGFAYSTVIAAGVANVVVFHAIKLLGPTRITGLQFLVPFVAVLLGAAFLSEAIQPAQLAGGAVIIAGVIVTRNLRLPFRTERLAVRRPG
ncbi:MAG: DMT family transporter [Chloroflexota bacterium]